MPDNKKIVFRADGSKKLGFGHLKRCAVLGKALKELGHEIFFLSAGADGAVESFFGAQGFTFKVVKASASRETVTEHLTYMGSLGSSVTVLDSYGVDDAYRAALKDAGNVVIALDDVYSHYYHADMVINHNPSADSSRYADFGGKILAGPHYALIDPAFGGVSRSGPSKAPPGILVTMGGTDAKNQTRRVLDLLDSVEEDFHITVLGGFYAGLPDVKRLSHPSDVISSTNEMPLLMGKCDAAITAGGVTCMELACAGLPFLLLVTDEFQLDNAKAYHDSCAGIFAGAASEISDEMLLNAIGEFVRNTERWSAMAENGRQLIGANGAKRAAAEISAITGK
ncbi:MAG: UDP-2,4-diacetamido-2,4,6-trideoxy-beta-L-altropyranose hydrolase [Nitrospinota bacterium]